MFERLALSMIAYDEEGNDYIIANINLAAIATALGMNYNSATGVMYMGSDSTTGFKFTVYPENNGEIEVRYINKGTTANLIISEQCAGQFSYLYYKKSSKGCAFGVGQSAAVIQAAWSTCYHGLTGTDKYCYFISYLYSQINGFDYCSILVEDGTYSSYNRGYAVGSYDDKMVALSPITIPEEPYICRYAFTPTTFRDTTDAEEFTMNGNSYVSGNAFNNTESSCRFVLEL